MRRLIHLIPHVRALLAHVEAVQADKIRIQDRNNWLESELEKCRELLERRTAQLIETQKMVANLGWQTASGYRPWPEAPGFPNEWAEAGTPGPIKPEHVMGQDVIRANNLDILRRWAAGETPGKEKAQEAAAV